MPAKKKVHKPKRIIRRKLLAAAVVAGTPLTQAARELGVSRSFASKEINSPAGRVIVDKMIDERSERIEAMLDLALDAVEELLRPSYTVTLKPRKGEKKPRIVEKITDPKVRLQAAKRVLEIALAGRAKSEDKGPTTSVTWQQYLTIFNAQKDGLTT